MLYTFCVMTKNKFFIFSILPVFLFISAHSQDAGPKLNSKDIGVLVDSVTKALNRWYIFPDKSALVEKTLKANYKKGLYNKANNSRELSMLLNTDIQATYKDKHLAVRYNPMMERHLLTTTPDSIIKLEEEMMLQDDRNRNFDFIKVEKLPGNIGYLRWDGFAGNLTEVTPIMDGAFRFVANTKALIIDMRYNGGGSPQTVLAMENYFFDKKIPMTHIIDFNKDTLKQYIDPAKTTFKLKMPVYILTGKITFSGAEDFTYGMKHSKRAVVVGDTSGGGAHPTDGFLAGKGFIINIPTARSYSEYTKTDWEGTGVYPDFPIKSEKAMAKAQALILYDLLSKTNDEDQKKRLKWDLNALRVKVSAKDSLKVPNEVLSKYCGEYTPDVIDQQNSNLSFILSCDNLIRKHPHPSVPDVTLIPVSNNKFIYGDDTGKTLEFVTDKNGKVTDLFFRWWTGEIHFKKL